MRWKELLGLGRCLHGVWAIGFNQMARQETGLVRAIYLLVSVVGLIPSGWQDFDLVLLMVDLAQFNLLTGIEV